MAPTVGPHRIGHETKVALASLACRGEPEACMLELGEPMNHTGPGATTRPVGDDAKSVLIIDDHWVARYGLRRLLEHAARRFDVAEAPDGTIGREQAGQLQPDLVILDLDLPTPRGTSALCHEIAAVAPTSRVLLYTAFEDTDQITACIAAGARGCVLKDAESHEIMSAIARVDAGETVIAPRIAERLAVRFAKEVRDDDSRRLTGRERAVLGHLGNGFSNRQIADQLFLSEHTVKGYVASLRGKLGARSRLEAVVLATRAGLLAPRDSHVATELE